MAKKAVHDAALALLVSDEQAYERAYREALERNERARQNLICLIISEAERQQMTKKALAQKAHLNYEFVRKVLTADGPNPTTQTALQLTDALGITLEARLASGERIALVA